MFEVIFKYHPKNSEGKYDSSETLEFSKKLGKAKEDLPMSKLAGYIMSQLARRDIWIIDLDVYEFARRKIVFKESKNGIILKNKKYSMSSDFSLEEIDFEVEKDIIEIPSEPRIVLQQETQPLHPVQQQFVPQFTVVPQVESRPIRYEIFKPEDHVFSTWLKNKGKGFQIDHKYGILEQIENPDGNVFYKVLDDFNCVRKMNSTYFMNMPSMDDPYSSLRLQYQ